MNASRLLLSSLVAGSLALPALAGSALADTKINVGMVIGGNGFHVPTYIAMDHGFFKKEGLDAHWVQLTGSGLVKAGLTGAADFVPIPSGGAGAALSGAKIVYVVGESLKSQWEIVVPKSINKVADLKGKTLGYGQEGGANYDEGAATLSRFFHMEPGKDYKVISFQSETGEIAALINGDVQGVLVSVPHAAVAVAAGYKVLLRTGDYLPRVGGTIWTPQAFYDKDPGAVKHFIRAIAEAITYFRDPKNKEGSVETLKKYLGIKNEAEAGIIWDQLHDLFGAEVPKDLFAKVFESRVKIMIKNHQWPADKKMPDPEHFLARKLLDSTLTEMHYVATNISAPTQ
jgi:NitT/TauT family transport system substrate-binding protein